MNVIGGGMISKSFENIDLGDITIFASGVSNSKENNKDEYTRELDLLNKTINESRKIIYFSTLSVYSNDRTDYIKHKLNVEEIIKNSGIDYIILRLPNVIGNTKNTKQLVPFLNHKIKNEEDIVISRNIKRDLLDVEDLPKICEFVLKKNINCTINVSLSNYIKVGDIVDLLKNIHKVKNLKENHIEMYENYKYKNEELLNLIEENIENLSTDPIKIITKYFKK